MTGQISRLKYCVLITIFFYLSLLNYDIFIKCQGVPESPPRVFSEQPSEGIPKPVGGSKRLTCTVYTYPSVVYSWTKDGEFVSQNSSTSVLTLQPLSRASAGLYRCLASNVKGALLSKGVQINVAFMDQIGNNQLEIKTVNEGDSVILRKPQIESVPSAGIDWYENNSTRSTEDLYHQITLSQDLVLLSANISRNNNKQYTGSAFNVATENTISKNYNLTVTRNGDVNSPIAPVFVVRPQNTFATVGDRKVILECIVNARPLTSLRLDWYKINGATKQKLDSSTRRIISAFKRQLLIPEPVKSDEGIYECEGRLDIFGGPSFTAITAQANLTIKVIPQIVPQLDSKLSRDFSQTAVLNCGAIGSPTPTLHWYFNGQPIESLSSNRHTTPPNGSLVITRVDLPDAGVYQCFARNDVGEASGSIWLEVNSSPPQITTAPYNLTIVEGREARFPCQANGAPQPTITWIKVTENSETNVVSGGSIQILERELLITSVSKSDTATYRCVATNLQGVAMAEAQLLAITKTNINRPPQNTTAIVSTSVTLECGVKHDNLLTPIWEWYFYKQDTTTEEKIVSDDRRLINNEGSLIIRGVDGIDIGKYKCQVISEGGNDSRIARLLVVELPSAPAITNVELNTGRPNSVRIRWDAPFNGYSPLIRYIIGFRIEDIGGGGTSENVRYEPYPAIIPPNVTSYIVANLRASRYYTFRISAINDVGEGPASVPKPDPPIQLPPQPPSAPPRNFKLSPRPNKEILVQWQPPEEDTWNGDLTGYQIRYKVAGLPDSAENVQNVSSWSTTNYLLKNLIYHKEYEVKIAAMNEKGIGAFSELLQVRTLEGRPTSPPRNVTYEVINSTTIKAYWSSPPPLEINGVIQAYTIELRRKSVPQIERPVYVASIADNPLRDMTAEIYGLSKYTEYVLRINCRTSQGSGPNSPEQTVRTAEDTPGKVEDLKFVSILDRSVKVQWSPPIDQNGELQSYTILYEKKNQTSTRKQIGLPATLTSYTIPDLVPVTKYTIYVYANTSKGKGPYAFADIESNVPPELPTAPHHLGVTNIETTSVLIQFLPGYNGKTSITLWIVEALEGSSTTWKEIYSISDPTASQVLVQNLKPFTMYSFRLIAENIVGRSNASEATRFRQTKMAAPGIPPGNVTVRALNSTELRISWTPVPRDEWHSEQIGYNLEYRMTPNNISTNTTFNRLRLDNGMNIASYILTNLQEWIEYDVRMSSYNDVGTSMVGPITKERTRESVPSASPSNVITTPTSSTSIRVTWQSVPYLQQNGLIQGYKVQYGSQGENIDAKLIVVEGNTTMEVILNNLRKFVTYEISALAFTRMGDGVLSRASVAQTDEDLPGPPIIIYFPMVNYSAAKMVWNPPSEPNGIITGYKVAYRKESDPIDSTIMSIELDHSTLEHTVGDLERETNYMFSVTARTRLGWGLRADVLVYTMVDRARPDSPSQPKIGSSQVYARNITISWSSGNVNYGPLRNYTIQYMASDSDWLTYQDHPPPEQSSYTITGLRPNTQYQFRVAATNDVGTSDFSVPSTKVQTLPDKPDGAPINVKVTAVTMTSINVTWQQPPTSTWNGYIQAYIVKYRQLSVSEYTEEIVPYTIFDVVIPKLVKKVYYEVQVLARNSIGRGPSSKPVTIFVGEAAPTAAPLQVVMETLSSTEIKLSWLPPPENTQNGGLTGYKVRFWDNDTTDPGEPTIVEETFVILEKLDIFTQYHATVQAYNLAGSGPETNIISATTDEGVPGLTGPLIFKNITMESLTVGWSEPIQPNGIIRKYELTYFLNKVNDVESKLVKLTLNGSQHEISVENLEEYGNYTFKVSARTSKGLGIERNASVKTGPQPGSPGPPIELTVSSKEKVLEFKWKQGSEGSSPIYGYMVQANLIEEDTWKTILQMYSRETSVAINYQKLLPQKQYLFRLMAMNSQGISRPVVVDDKLDIPGPILASTAKPFHQQWWFLVIVALTGVIIILVIVSLLCMVGRKRQTKQNEMKRSQTNTTVISESPDTEDDGFATFEMMRQSQRRTLPRNGANRNIYATSRVPPRPSPASVTYSGEDLATGTSKSHMGDDDSSVTEKPSELGDSTEPSDDESDDISVKEPASPPPPPFPGQYSNNNNNDNRQSWRFQSPYNAYAYTDSEADSSHYAMSLNTGQIQFNQSRSRTPLAGFSSFV